MHTYMYTHLSVHTCTCGRSCALAVATELSNARQPVRMQVRMLHPHHAGVIALPATTSLLDLHREAASKPNRGRPPDSAYTSEATLTAAKNWANGGFIVESMIKRAAFDDRRINISHAATQAHTPPFAYHAAHPRYVLQLQPLLCTWVPRLTFFPSSPCTHCSQQDVLEGTGLTINGAPTTLTELRMYKPSRRRLYISHQTTARLHA